MKAGTGAPQRERANVTFITSGMLSLNSPLLEPRRESETPLLK